MKAVRFSGEDSCSLYLAIAYCSQDERERFFNLGTPRAKFFCDTSQIFLSLIKKG